MAALNISYLAAGPTGRFFGFTCCMEGAPRHGQPRVSQKRLSRATQICENLATSDSRVALSSEAETVMVLLEMSIVPLGVGDSVSPYVAECVALVDQSGLDYELHSMGTIVEGELPEVLALMQRCIEKMAEHSDRVSCSAKLDFRRGKTGRIKSKVTSVEQKLDRKVSK